MPEIDISSWNIASKRQKADPGIIEGIAEDVTNRPSIEEDVVDLTSEPEFPEDKARDRETLQAEASDGLHRYLNSLPFGPIRQLDSKRLHTKWSLFEQLNPTIPLNEFNLPNYYYRADMLDHHHIQHILLMHEQAHNPMVAKGVEFSSEEPDLFNDGSSSYDSLASGSTTTAIRVSPQTAVEGLEDIQSQLEAAMVTLDYGEGFPALPNGVPFWRRLDTEPENAFDAFVGFIELGPTRKRVDLIAYPPEEVTAWYHMYAWAYRVKSFDLFRVVDANKRRLHRMLSTEDDHYNVAEKLMRQIAPLFEGAEFAEKLKALDPDKLIGVLEKVTKLQRVSVGLNANGGAIDASDLKKAPTTNVLVQQIVQNAPETAQKQEDMPDLLTESPDAVDLAQELIIRTQQGQSL